jgi:small-conductance mechanosensitive channel
LSKKMKRKIAFMIVVEVLFLAILGALLMAMQTNLSIDNQRENIAEKLDEMDEVLENAEVSSAQTTESYDEIYQSKAASLAYMYQNGVLTEYDNASVKEAQSLLDADNVLILDRTGNILAQAQESPADFTHARYNQLRTVFDTGEVSQAFEVETGEEKYRYFGARIDDNVMAVIEENPRELDDLLEATSTWESILSNITVGLDGFSFAVSAKDYTFLYYPDEELTGMDALTNGISVSELEDNNYTWVTVDGQKLYCGIRDLKDAYVFCAVTSDEILASRNTTVMIILFAFFVVLTLVITYAFFLAGQHEGEKKVRLFGKFYFNGAIGKKIGIVSLVGLICILLISFYMQTLFSLSRQSMSNAQRVQEVEQEIDRYSDESDRLKEQYNERYLNKAQIATYIINARPELANRESLADLSSVLDVESVNVFDANGVQTATNSPYTKFSVSSDPEDQSYEFNKLLQGVDYLIQEAQADDVSGEYHQYIGVTLRDDAYNPSGFVQISIKPEKLEESISNMRIDHILPNIKMGSSGIVFAVEKENNTFAYYPNERLIGRKAVKYGLQESQLVDEYDGYITLSGEKYFASSVENGNYYIYAAVPEDSIGGRRLPITVASVFASFLALAVVFVLLTVSRKAPETEEVNNGERKDKTMIDITMPDGSQRKTQSAASRWKSTTVKWNEKTPEQKMFLVLKWMLGILSLIICIAVVMQDRFFDKNSIFRYVISGRWARGVNIFAVTGALLIICVAVTVTTIVQKILAVMSQTFSAKGETVCRLLRSFIKYFSVVAILYYTLALFGIDTRTLLASAGILGLVIGLGAQSLVSDILAGMFIIFEGEFRVGDIVTIGDWRGTVVEIGIRTTKIQDGGQNIKIISNRDVCGVINMTRDYSYAWVDLGIEYGESLERVENVLEQEFPNIRRRLTGIIDGPFYKGVVALADNSVNIRVMVLCSEADRGQMERDLNREMKLIFDKYEINVPFPQIVVNQPVEFKKATEWEKRRAEKFAAEQRELAGRLVEDDEDEH